MVNDTGPERLCFFKEEAFKKTKKEYKKEIINNGSKRERKLVAQYPVGKMCY